MVGDAPVVGSAHPQVELGQRVLVEALQACRLGLRNELSLLVGQGLHGRFRHVVCLLGPQHVNRAHQRR